MAILRKVQHLFLPLLSFPSYEPREQEITKDDNIDLLNIIFGVDDTGFPRNDLGLLQSENTNPEIVAFVKSQLLKEQKPVDMASGEFHQLSDDDLFNMARRENESNTDYAYRLRDYLIDQQREIQRVKYIENRKKQEQND